MPTRFMSYRIVFKSNQMRHSFLHTN